MLLIVEGREITAFQEWKLQKVSNYLSDRFQVDWIPKNLKSFKAAFLKKIFLGLREGSDSREMCGNRRHEAWR